MGWEFSYVHFSISLCYEGITEKIFHSALCMQRIIDDRQSLNCTHFQTRKRRARCEVNKAFCIQDRCIKCIMQSTHREREREDDKSSICIWLIRFRLFFATAAYECATFRTATIDLFVMCTPLICLALQISFNGNIDFINKNE